MVDCGAVMEKSVSDEGGGRGAADENQRISIPAKPFPPAWNRSTAVFLTHAHVDHLGRLPLLVERGFTGPIYMTEATAALAVPMLRVLVRMRPDPAAALDLVEGARVSAPRPSTRRSRSIGATASTAAEIAADDVDRRPVRCRS